MPTIHFYQDLNEILSHEAYLKSFKVVEIHSKLALTGLIEY